MTSQQFVNKTTYQEWESKVVKQFYSQKQDKIFTAIKKKVIVVLIPHASHSMSYIVESSRPIGLPNKSKLDMYHIGNEQTDKVSM